MRTEKQLALSLEDLRIVKPLWGDYLILAFFLKGKNYLSEGIIRRLLKRFVPKDDYERKDVDKLVEHLIKQTKHESI